MIDVNLINNGAGHPDKDGKILKTIQERLDWAADLGITKSGYSSEQCLRWCLDLMEQHTISPRLINLCAKLVNNDALSISEEELGQAKRLLVDVAACGVVACNILNATFDNIGTGEMYHIYQNLLVEQYSADHNQKIFDLLALAIARGWKSYSHEGTFTRAFANALCNAHAYCSTPEVYTAKKHLISEYYNGSNAVSTLRGRREIIDITANHVVRAILYCITAIHNLELIPEWQEGLKAVNTMRSMGAKGGNNE